MSCEPGAPRQGCPVSADRGFGTMIQVRRLGAVGAALALAALLTCTQVRGGPGKDDELKKWRASGAGAAPAEDVEGDLAATKFADHKVVTYLTKDKDTAFGWQLQPAL